mmetsp:Transcript_16682/g.25714  ORF Transcript_16682/g.25714 Transcript_16682/m.25714 type:complete len:134 (-) Transcript_16682:234-635(-)
MSATTLFTFGLNMVFQGAMKEILGTILSMQIIINLFLFTIPFPANISTYIHKLKPIVSFNILKALTTFTKGIFKFDVDAQAELKPKILLTVQDLGTKTHNAIPNLGNMFHLLSYYLVLVGYLIYLNFRGISSL